MTPIIDFNKLIERAKDKDIDFIATCITPWHAIGAKSFIEYLRDKKKCCRGLILITSLNEKYYLSLNNFREIDNVEVYYLKREWKPQRPLLKRIMDMISLLMFKYEKNRDFNNLYLSSPWHPDIYLGTLLREARRNLIFCRTDEGLGTYWNETFRFCLTEQKNNLIASLKLYLLVKNMRRFERSNSFIDFAILSGSKCLLPKANIIPYIRKVIRQERNMLSVNQNFPENTVIICTQPIEQNNLNIWEKVISRLINENYNVVIKPHPREENVISKYGKLGCHILAENNIGMETLICDMKGIKAVISLNSSASVYASAIWGIKGILLLKLFPDSIISEQLKAEFESKYSSLVSFPDTVNDIPYILKQDK